MRKGILTSMALLFAGVIGGLQSANAHHSFAMFDSSQEKLVVGEVVKWAFNNPHSWLYIRGEDANGEMVTWGFEGAAQVHAMRQGVNGNTFQNGDRVKVIMKPLKSGENAGAMCFVQKVEDGSIARPNDGVCDSQAVAEKWRSSGRLENAAHLDTFPVDS